MGWWDLPEEQIAEEVLGIARRLRDNDAPDLARIRENLRVYEGRYIAGLAIDQYARQEQPRSDEKTLVTNHARNAVGAVQAKIAGRNRPKAMFLTNNGDGPLKQRARKLQKFVDGVMRQPHGNYADAWELFADVEVDVLTSPRGGAVRVDCDDARVWLDRVHGHELFVDKRECAYGSPRSLFHITFWDADVLAARFPEHKAHIMYAADQVADKLARDTVRVAKLVEVVCAWHLPSGSKTKDGRYVIAVTGKCLGSSEWTRNTFPFVFSRWERERMGFWATALMDVIRPIQDELNEMTSSVSREARVSTTRIFAELESIDKDELTNIEDSIVWYNKGAPKPEQVQGQAITREKLDYAAILRGELYAVSGVSEDRATSARKQSGLSGVARRIDDDQETERFSIVAREYNRMFAEVAKQIVAAAREYAASDGSPDDFEVKWPGKGFVESISWSECSLEDDQYFIQVDSVSSLPSSPAGKMAAVQEMAEAGWINSDEAKRLLEFPDLEDFRSLAAAQDDFLDDLIASFDGFDPDDDEFEFIGPDPRMPDLPRAISTMVLARMRAIQRKASPEVIDNYDRWLELASGVPSPHAAAAATTPPVMQPAPPPPPLPPPPMPGAPPNLQVVQ